MKKVLILFICLLANISFSQVGINTITPRKTLEVKGNTEIDGTIKIGTVNRIENADNYTFLMQEGNNNIRSLDLTKNGEGNALGYILTFTLNNVNLDWIDEYNTLISSNKYTVVVTSYQFSEQVGNVPDISGLSTDEQEGFSIPAVSAFADDNTNTWKLKADYPQIDSLDGTTNGTWTINVLIMSKDIIRTFDDRTFDLNNSETSADPSPIFN